MSNDTLQQFLNRRRTQNRNWRKTNTANLAARTLEHTAWIWKVGALQEEQRDPLGISRDGNECIAGALRWAKSTDQGVVVVIDEFEASGEQSR